MHSLHVAYSHLSMLYTSCSPEYLRLENNTLTGRVPSEIFLLTNLGETWLATQNGVTRYHLAICHRFKTVPHYYFLQSYPFIAVELYLSDNRLTGDFTCPKNITDCRISCADPSNEECHSLWSQVSHTRRYLAPVSTSHQACWEDTFTLTQQ